VWRNLAQMSEDWIEDHYLNDDFLPMRNLILRLQKKEYAESVFAFTSLYTFIITLRSEYHSRPKDSIAINFESITKFFDVGYYDAKSTDGVSYRCVEKQVENLVDAFALRLFLTENNEELKVEAEEFPSFQLGQEVETIPERISRKPHKGKIFEIVRHHKQKRFIYFIEEDGKKLKKRYFKENLKTI
jgi:hypothetical protein